MIGKHYGYKVWEMQRLTFKQVDRLLTNLRYVVETSPDLSKAPPADPPLHPLIDFAVRCGIEVPYDIRYDIIIYDMEQYSERRITDDRRSK